VCMYACMCKYHVCMYVCMSVYVCMYACMHTCMYVLCTDVSVYVCICMYVYLCMYAYVYMYVCVSIHKCFKTHRLAQFQTPASKRKLITLFHSHGFPSLDYLISSETPQMAVNITMPPIKL